MNLNKQDFATAIIAIGLTESLKEVDMAATVIAGEYATGTENEQLEFIRHARDAVANGTAKLQQLTEKLDAERTRLEGPGE